MPSTPTLFLFSGAAITLLLIPGPAVLYIIARSASQGTRAGLVSVAGIHLGTTVHVAAAVAGLSALVVASAAAFTTVKLAGAAYLVYLGIRSFRELRRHAEPGEPTAELRPLRRVFRDAVLVNVLNPKTAVFFLAFVPQFVDPSAGGATTQLLALSALFIVLGLLSDGAYALAAGWLSSRITGSAKGRRRSQSAAGTAYIGLGIVTAVAARS